MKRRPSLMLLLVIALLVLLPLLAVLQYRWLGEVSAADRERRQANLKTSAERFSADFDRELTSVYLQLQTAAPASNGLDEILVSRFQTLLANASRPKLIRELYRTRFDEQGRLLPARFNPVTQALETVEWPENLKSIRAKFEAQRQAQQSAKMATQMMLRSVLGQTQERFQTRAGRGFVFQISYNQIADDVPALIVPDVGQHSPTAPIFPDNHSNTIAVLDLDYIQSELIPELARRHFLADGMNDYNLAIVRRSEGREIIFQTDANLPIQSFEQSDIKNSLFRIRPEELDRIIIAGIPSPIGLPSAASSPMHGNPKIVGSESNQVSVGVFQSDINIKESGHETATGSPLESALPKLESPLPKQLLKRGEDGCWQLLVKHRAGSLDAAVAGVRRRNLGISFGILLLLGVSVGFIVLSSRRSQHLAAQQMEFVAGVSHELRTPLAVICSAAENLADGVPGLIDNREQVKRYGGLIRDEGRRLTGMVEQVLEFAGAQSGRKTYELRPTELHRVIEDALAACHLQLIDGEFEIEKHLPADLPLVKADASALSRAVQNLLSNAMKYSGDNRWIGLKVQTLKSERGGEIQIQVSDRGLGIPPSELPHIFEPFYRGKEVVAGQIHGNGLGLSLVKHIVEAHGGQVSVESKIGQGSVFTLRLPVITAEEFSAEKVKEVYEQTHLAR